MYVRQEKGVEWVGKSRQSHHSLQPARLEEEEAFGGEIIGSGEQHMFQVLKTVMM